MGFLRRYREQPEAKEFTLQERFEEATLNVEAAVRDIEALRAELGRLKASNQLTMDPAGNILTLAVADPAERRAFEIIAHELATRISAAEQDFYNKLRAWSALKCQIERQRIHS